jgi:hypothetical protein
MILEAIFDVALVAAGLLGGCWITLWLHERGVAVEDAERAERRKGFDIAHGFVAGVHVDPEFGGPTRTDCDMDARFTQDRTET